MFAYFKRRFYSYYRLCLWNSVNSSKHCSDSDDLNAESAYLECASLPLFVILRYRGSPGIFNSSRTRVAVQMQSISIACKRGVSHVLSSSNRVPKYAVRRNVSVKVWSTLLEHLSIFSVVSHGHVNYLAKFYYVTFLFLFLFILSKQICRGDRYCSHLSAIVPWPPLHEQPVRNLARASSIKCNPPLKVCVRITLHPRYGIVDVMCLL